MSNLPVILLAVSIATVSAPAMAAAPSKATVGVPDIEQAIELINLLDSRVGQPIPEGTNWFEVLPGSVPVILTAPHATRPFGERGFRFADGGGTAALAVAVHKLCGVTVIHTTFDSPSDPNFYDDNAFKNTLPTASPKRWKH